MAESSGAAANQLESDLNIVASANLATPDGVGGPICSTSRATRPVTASACNSTARSTAKPSATRTATPDRLPAGTQKLHVAIGPRRTGNSQRSTATGTATGDLRSGSIDGDFSRPAVGGGPAADSPRQGGGRFVQLAGYLERPECAFGARNALAAGYISYEQLRVQLLLDLEALELDVHGYPIDERRSHPADAFAGDRAAGHLPPAPVLPLHVDLRRGRPPARLAVPPSLTLRRRCAAGRSPRSACGASRSSSSSAARPTGRADFLTAPVVRGDLAVTVTERGELDSINSIMVRCEVEGEKSKLVSIVPGGDARQEGPGGRPVRHRRTEEALLDQQKVKWKTAEGKWKSALGRPGRPAEQGEERDR